MSISFLTLPSRSFHYKPDFDECVSRIYAWYEQKILDRVPVRFHHHNVEYERFRVVKGPWETAEDRWLDVDFQVDAFCKSLDCVQFFGETFPVFWPNLSAVVYNLFLGQSAEFDDVTAWTRPIASDLMNFPELGVQKDGRYFRAIDALTDRALDIADGRFMVGYTDMYAGIDCVLGLRGMEQMCLDVLTDPCQLKALIDKTWAEYPAVYCYFDRKLKARGQLSVTWMNIPSFDTMNVLACDFATAISPEQFDDICMPIIRREAECFTHNIFHIDGPGVAKNIDSILTVPNLSAVQWVQGYGTDRSIMQWIPLIDKIQAAGKSVIVDLELDELDDFMRKVDPRGIMLWIPAPPENQQDVLNRVKNW